MKFSILKRSTNWTKTWLVRWLVSLLTQMCWQMNWGFLANDTITDFANLCLVSKLCQCFVIWNRHTLNMVARDPLECPFCTWDGISIMDFNFTILILLVIINLPKMRKKLIKFCCFEIHFLANFLSPTALSLEAKITPIFHVKKLSISNFGKG